MKFGVLGKSLPHSYSPRIHRAFADYDYTILERTEDEVHAIFDGKEKLDGFNVTIPYKKLAYNLCRELSDEAKEVGAVNTVVSLTASPIAGSSGSSIDEHDENGAKTCGFKGFNTDVCGFVYMLRRAGIEVDGKNCLILGTGGASAAVSYALKTLKAARIDFCSRSGSLNYENVYTAESDVQIIVNTTPVGMFPSVAESPIDLSRFPKLYAAADIVYNPARTRFLSQAEGLGIKHAGGLSMLVAQAYKASLIFRGKPFSLDVASKEDEILLEKVIKTLESEMMNITLVGMPGCGKSMTGRKLAAALEREFVDLDAAFESEYGQKPSTVIKEKGEGAFREMETELAKKILPKSGLIIATGGGIVTRKENWFYLKTNSKVIYLKRPLETLMKQDVNDRPVSSSTGIETLYKQRSPLYEAVCDEIWDLPDFSVGDDLIDSLIEKLAKGE